jgi:hypothetical protein
MKRYEVIADRVWQHKDGRRASIYGGLPWISDADKPGWSLAYIGWTVRDNMFNTVGAGRQPWKTQQEAQAFCDQHN